jgi:hypothetical protein
MTIANTPADVQNAIDMLYGEPEARPADGPLNPITQAVAQAVQQLQHMHEEQLDSKRLGLAADLVLGHGVTINLDGSSAVQSGKRFYSQRDRACSCPDHQHRQSYCKHLMAVDLYQLAQSRLNGAPASESLEPAVPVSAAWDCKEAPVSCYFKMRVGHLEMSYTMRDVNDEHMAARVKTMLPKIQRLMDYEAQRQAEHAAEHAATRLSAQNQGNDSKPPAMPAASEEAPNEDGDKWCSYHQAWMPERSNDKGSWHSHPAADEQGQYYCKGQGRPSRNRR